MRRKRNRGEDLNILFSFPRPAETSNPYVTNLVEGVQRHGVTPRFFSLRAVLIGPVDVVHVHWPEGLTEGSTWLRMLVKRALTAVLLARVRLRSIPVVRTVHNLKPHEGASRLGLLLDKILERITDARIYLNEADEDRPDGSVVILHPRYDELQSNTPRGDPSGSRVFSFGFLRPYKGYETLINIWRDVCAPAELTVAGGMAGNPNYRDRLAALVAEVDGVTLQDVFLPEDELQQRIKQSTLVVLPYASAYNSGAVLLALSLGVPVLTGRSSSMEALRREVGDKWLHLFDAPVTADAVEAALASARQTAADAPDLHRRDMCDGARMHVALYQALWAAGHRGRWYLNRAAQELFANHSPLNRGLGREIGDDV